MVPRHNEVVDDLARKICKDLAFHRPIGLKLSKEIGWDSTVSGSMTAGGFALSGGKMTFMRWRSLITIREVAP
jgi:hypothetical protein